VLLRDENFRKRGPFDRAGLYAKKSTRTIQTKIASLLLDRRCRRRRRRRRHRIAFNCEFFCAIRGIANSARISLPYREKEKNPADVATNVA